MTAIVFKAVGDPMIADAIMDGMTQKVIPLDDGELRAVKEEVGRLRAQNDIRACGDAVRFETACKALAIKYKVERHGRLYNAILTVWGTLWAVIYEVYDYLSAWNREG